MKVSLPPRNVWLEWLKNAACAVALTFAVGAGAVIAASESQQPMAGNAIVVLCGAIGRCRGAVNPEVSVPRGTVVQSLTHSEP
ncbi:hypothetical protein [Variovorax sp. IB41]|uniref:hypothetical protein n=1 Tax=Variovorax sp. IB41 TaxID=2779370 RepID=UPI0018E87291|nr:hypothetical protein [Variovorax sp. IB41]MBJ2160395.1 hypothetical protein [Variovorax sp. IB41]